MRVLRCVSSLLFRDDESSHARAPVVGNIFQHWPEPTRAIFLHLPGITSADRGRIGQCYSENIDWDNNGVDCAPINGQS